MSFEADNNIPAPPTEITNADRLREFMQTMQVGQSVFIADSLGITAFDPQTPAKWQWRTDRAFGPSGEKGRRMWRLEDAAE